MSNSLLGATLTASLLLGGCAASAPVARQPLPPPPPPPTRLAQQPAGPVSYQVFYDELSPYGQWTNDPEYGYVWVPNAEPGFQPYRSRGHWAYTDYGWTWVSDYAWGWAAFHYGRWRYSDFAGWVWVPGYTWGPAWVAWRQSQGYYGWAPLGPPPPRPGGLRVDIGVSFSFGDAPVEPSRWCFVPAAYVASPRLATYYVPPTQTAVVYNNTTIIHNTYVSNTTINNTTINEAARPDGGRREAFPAGPARADVERASGQPLQPLRLAPRATPGAAAVQGNALAVYRPAVAPPSGSPSGSATAASLAPAPRRVVPLDAVRPARPARPAPAESLSPPVPGAARPAEAARRELPDPALAAPAAPPAERVRSRPDAAPRPTFDAAPGAAPDPRPQPESYGRRDQPAPTPARRDPAAAESRPPRQPAVFSSPPERAPRPRSAPKPPREPHERRR